ncbi:hypothetical protein BHM03_00021674 [Ensete ventricosum]|nr:hypothetical protein BHM03_00021674 [Ensete ventricosum]
MTYFRVVLICRSMPSKRDKVPATRCDQGVPRGTFSLRKMKSSGSAGSGSTTPSTTSTTPAMEVAASMAEKHPETGEDALTEKGKEPAGKGKESTEVDEVLERGYSIRDLREVEDRVGTNGYFASIMTRLSPSEGEELLTLRWSSIPRSARVWTEGPLAAEYLRGALHPILAKQLYECSSEELMNRAAKSAHQHERITALQTANKELKLGVSQEVVAAAKHREKELKATVDQLRVELGALQLATALW